MKSTDMQNPDTYAQIQLKLYEGLVLLALHDEEGTTQGWYLEYTIGAAVLAELLMLNRIRVNSENKDRVEIVDASPTGDKVMDEVLAKIAAKKRPDTLKNWVMTVGYTPNLKEKVADQLVDDGIIKSDERKLLWVFTQKIYPEINPEPERYLRQEMRRLVLEQPSDLSDIDPRYAILIALAKSSHLLAQVFSKAEIKTHKKRIDEVAKGEALDELASDVISSVQAAVMVAVMLPSMMAAVSASTTSSSSC